MELSLAPAAHDDLVRIEVRGRMTSTDFETGHRDPLEALAGHGVFARKTLVDMQRVSFIDSAAVGWLIARNKVFKEKGGKLVLHSLPPNVDKVFRLLKMESVFALAVDEGAAEALVAGEGT